MGDDNGAAGGPAFIVVPRQGAAGRRLWLGALRKDGYVTTPEELVFRGKRGWRYRPTGRR